MKRIAPLWRSLIAMLMGTLAACLPARAWAACGVSDPGGCVDGALYSFWYGLAGLGWSLDRTLLLLAYQLDSFRWWLVEVAFSSAYQVLIQVIDPLILPFATLAVIVGCFGVLLLPIFGRVNLVNVRHALVWSLLAPLLITLSGPAIVQLEQIRSEVSTTLFSGVSAVTPGAIFGAAATDMGQSTPLYPANPCGTGTLARTSAGGLRLDDLAAALLWADAEDIHCPDFGGPSADIPDLFFDAAPSGPGYARDEDISLMDAGNDRTQAVQNIQRGAVRTFLGLLPATLAVLDALVQLVFALCLIALWIGLPIGLVFVFFEQTAGGITGLFRRLLSVLQVSWSTSVLLGLVGACLIAAAQLRNAAAYTGFAIGGIILTTYMLLVAVETFKGCVRTLNDTVMSATGLSVTQPFAVAGGAATSTLQAGAALATGGAATALTAAAAFQQTGSGRYAAASAAGRIRPLAQLGEVAAAMGWVRDEEVLEGLHAGGRSRQGGWRGARLQMTSDAKRRDDAGRTFRDRVEERQLERQLDHTQRPTVVQELGQAMSGGRAAASYVAGGHLAQDAQQTAAVVPDLVRSGWGNLRHSWRRFGEEVSDRSGGSRSPLRQSAAVAQVLDDQLRPGRRHAVMRLDERRQLRYDDPPASLPAEAITVARAQARIPRLLTLGYAVQERRDGQVSLWKPDAAQRGSSQDQRAQVEERLGLIKSGALLGDPVEVQRELDQLRAAPRTPAVPANNAPDPKGKA
jgi:hypothetical protein